MLRRFILLVLPLVTLCAIAQVPDKECFSLSKKPADADKLLPVVKLNSTQIEHIERERACLEGYTYPGGEEALVNASSAQVYNDLTHLTKLFDDYSKLQIKTLPKTLPKNDQLRVLRMERGWNRDQVLLWGNWFYLRQLDAEQKYATILKEAQRIRAQFGLNVAPLTGWDDADANTYFSIQTLRNMIVAYEYSAKGHMLPPSGPERQALVSSYLRDERALAPMFSFTGNPGKAVLGPICEKQTAKSGQ